MKRVLFIINKMNSRPSSGHAIFMKGVIETLYENNCFVDVVCDGDIEENFIKEYGVNIYTPDSVDRLAYTKHSYLFQFEDSFNFEKSINYRAALTKALSNHIYDLVICNDLESAFVCNQMGLHSHMKVVSYAHECATANPELKEGVFKDCYYDLIDHMMSWPEITTLVQTDQNKTNIENRLQRNLNIKVQHYPLTDSKVVHSLEKEGILYIGRHEDRKNPAMFIKVLADIKDKYGIELKAKVLTRSAHVKKFEADFESIGHTNYEIKSDVVGDEKAQLIQSAKIAYMPYKNESFGIAVLEALRFMPTVVLDKYDWHYNFEEFSNYIVADTKEVADIIWSAYNTWTVDETKVEKEFEKYNKRYCNELLNLLNDKYVTVNNNTEPRNRLYSYLKNHIGTYVSVTDYFKKENSKGIIYLTSDIEILYTSKNWFNILHTTDSTYIGIPDVQGNLTLPNIETNTISNFFE